MTVFGEEFTLLLLLDYFNLSFNLGTQTVMNVNRGRIDRRLVKFLFLLPDFLGVDYKYSYKLLREVLVYLNP